MQNRQDFIDDLIIKHLQQNLTKDEKAVLDQWLSASAENKKLFEKLVDEQYVSKEVELLYAYDEEKNWNNLKQQFTFDEEKKVKKFDWKKIAVAASLLLAVGLGSYLVFFGKKDKQEQVVVTAEPTDIKAPQSNRAMITMENGKQVYLDNAINGKLLEQGGIEVVKLADGKIVYKGSSDEVVYNTLTNPKGSKVIDMTLADGSRVWLNAGSSVTFPIAFAGKERKVSITGEAYFEVAHNAAMPFKLSKGEMEVTVLGTHFNVNAYDDEAEIKVTLLEGSVKTSIVNGELSILKPGEQAQVSNSIKVMKDVDTDVVMAWKNGYFNFKNADIKILMREIARWYDVDVEYDGAVPKQRFGGEMRRNNDLSQVLEILKTSGVKFLIEGRKVTIRP